MDTNNYPLVSFNTSDGEKLKLNLDKLHKQRLIASALWLTHEGVLIDDLDDGKIEYRFNDNEQKLLAWFTQYWKAEVESSFVLSYNQDVGLTADLFSEKKVDQIGYAIPDLEWNDPLAFNANAMILGQLGLMIDRIEKPILSKAASIVEALWVNETFCISLPRSLK